jgi:tetratricopeptide (TPR) repeat protein
MLASIYQEKNQKKSYEIVARRLMKVYQKKKKEDRIAALEKEFPGLKPAEKKAEPIAVEVPAEEAKPEEAEPEIVEAELEVAEPELEAPAPEEPEPEIAEPELEAPAAEEPEPEIAEPEPAMPEVSEETPDEFIVKNLEIADNLIQQGLVRNAKRILEDLKARFPDDTQVSKKIQELGAIASQVKEDEIVEQVERIAEKDKELFEESEKLTSAEIFADTDIVPLVSQETGEKKYFDLSHQLEEELDAIQQIISQQTRGDTTIVEKELSSIVSDFSRKVDEKIGTVDLEARYNLGIAYLEQGLIDEAIKEFKLASQEKKWELESFTNLGECYKRKSDFGEAIKWFEKALQLVEAESIQAYALKYEIASLYEAKNESDKALQLFAEVLEWNSEYGDVTTRIKTIEEQASK